MFTSELTINSVIGIGVPIVNIFTIYLKVWGIVWNIFQT